RFKQRINNEGIENWDSEEEPCEKNEKNPPNDTIKNSFIHSNCQILLFPGVLAKDFLICTNNIVPFDKILLVIKTCIRDEISCPICLDEPTASIITKCGHIFCWRCIIECILSNNSPTHCKCPICYQIITSTDIRIVLWKYDEHPKINDKITMNLCVRNKNQLHVKLITERSNELPSFIYPILELTPGRWVLVPDPTNDNNKSNYLTHVFKFPKDRTSLTCFFESIHSFMLHQKDDFDMNSISFRSVSLILDNVSLIKNLVTDDLIDFTTEFIDIDENYSVLFYQMPLEYNVFLHPSNFGQICGYIKGCKQKYEEAPRVITGNVVHYFHGVINRHTWKRYKFLSHLPLHSQYTLCLVTLTNPIMPVIEYEKNTDLTENEVDTDNDENLYYYNHSSNKNTQFSVVNFTTKTNELENCIRYINLNPRNP
ncbi:hypothetical protein HZS_1476, partial [Henneguya salminicola]